MTRHLLSIALGVLLAALSASCRSVLAEQSIPLTDTGRPPTALNALPTIKPMAAATSTLLPLTDAVTPTAVMGELCSGIDMNPPELTFEAAYCAGGDCVTAQTQAACEAIDVLGSTTEIVAGQDGIPDCVWREDNPRRMGCYPRW